MVERIRPRIDTVFWVGVPAGALTQAAALFFNPGLAAWVWSIALVLTIVSATIPVTASRNKTARSAALALVGFTFGSLLVRGPWFIAAILAH